MPGGNILQFKTRFEKKLLVNTRTYSLKWKGKLYTVECASIKAEPLFNYFEVEYIGSGQLGILEASAVYINVISDYMTVLKKTAKGELVCTLPCAV